MLVQVCAVDSNVQHNIADRSYRALNMFRQEITTPANGDHATAADDSAVAERLFRSSSPDLTPYIVGGGSIAPGLHCAMDERVAAVKPTSASLGFPLSHVLEFGRKARGERQSLGTRLSEELGVPYTTALAALEAFGEESERARHWLPTQQVHVGSVYMNGHRIFYAFYLPEYKRALYRLQRTMNLVLSCRFRSIAAQNCSMSW